MSRTLLGISTASLADLVTRCRAGDRKAQEQLFQSYYSDFLKLCLRYAPDVPSAEAALSDAFFKIFTKIDGYGGTGSFEGWMRRIVVTTCLSHLRSSGAPADALPEADGDWLPVAGGHTPNEGPGRLSMQEALACIHTLPPMQRAVFNLYVFDGYAHREIAGMLGIGESTAQAHLSNARKTLRTLLQPR